MRAGDDAKYSKLRIMILIHFGTGAEFAKAMEISDSALSRKMHGYLSWTNEDVEKMQELFQMNSAEVRGLLGESK